MGTVIILPELGQVTAAWQDLVVGHRQKQVVDYEPLLEGAPEFEELSAQITALVRAAEQPVTIVIYPQTGQTAPTLLKRGCLGQVVNHRPVPGERDRQRPRPGGQGPRLTVSRQPLCSR